MTTKIHGTTGVEFPDTTVQSSAALPLTGGTLTGNFTVNSPSYIRGGGGSAALPSIQPGVDADTGMYLGGTNIIGFSTTGTERMTINATGAFTLSTESVGINGTDPILVTSGSATAALRANTGSYSAQIVQYSTGEAYFQSNGGPVYYGTTASQPVLFRTNSAEIMRISGDNWILGATTNNTSTPGIWGGTTYTGAGYGRLNYIKGTASGTGNTAANAFYYNGTQVGAINCSSTATAFATSSDYRLKEDVQPMAGALEKLAQVRPVTFKWKADGQPAQGFIAHELQAVFPDAVSGEKDAVDEEGTPLYQGVDSSFLVATLVAAIQELTAKVAALEAKP